MNFWKNANSKWMIGLGIGIVCLVIGAYDNQLEEMYRKAVMICLECIGIG